MKIKMTALELILHLAEGSTTPNTLQHITKIAKATLDEMKEQPAPATELREQEPVAWRTYTGRGYYIIDATLEEAQRNWPDKQHQPLYTSPPTLSLAQRQARSADTWVSLTDEEVEDCMEMSIQKTCRAIEAKLRSKNEDRN